MSILNIRRTSLMLRFGLVVIIGLTFLIGLLLTMSVIPKTAQAQVYITTGEAYPVLVETDYNGKLINVVQVTPEEGVTSTYTETSIAQGAFTTTIPIPEAGAYIGAYIDDLSTNYTATLVTIQAFEGMTGRRLAIVNQFWSMTINGGQYADFDWLNLAEYYADSRILMISWDPKDSTTGEPITYQGIISGYYDDVIRPAAQDAAKFGKPMFIRWSWEMDGYWYPHSGPNAFGLDGTQPWTKTNDLYGYFGDPDKADGPERFVAAWRHIRRIFDEEEADNVIWVWSPNWLSFPEIYTEAYTATWNTLSAYYPGDDQVDWIGTSIYYRGDQGNKWLAFPRMFNHQTGSGLSIAEFHALHPEKPVMIAEIGAAENKDGKAYWYEDTYKMIKEQYPYIKAVIVFSVKKENEPDWRVESSNVSLHAFCRAISDPYYLDQVFTTSAYLTSTEMNEVSRYKETRASNSLTPCPKTFLPLINKS